MDYFSIPQAPGSRENQAKAICSIPNYFMCATHTLILVRDMANFLDNDGGYLSRGHCLLELATTKLPRVDVFGLTYVPGFEPSGDWGSTVLLECVSGVATRLEWKHFINAGSPCDGNFTCEDDRPLIRQLVAKYVDRFTTCERLLEKLKECSTFQEYHNLDIPNSIDQIQTWKADRDETKRTPREWVEQVLLPGSYVTMLKASLSELE